MVENQKASNEITDTKIWKEAEILTSDLMKYLPNEEISKFSVFHSALKYLKKTHWGIDWKTKIDCYLGIPCHIENLSDLEDGSYSKFPLALVSSLTIQKPIYFALLREECIDGTTLKGDSHLMHFTPSEFARCEEDFEEILNAGNLNAFKYFADDRGLYMQDENLDEKLINNEIEYAYFYKEALLNEEYYLRLDILKADVFLVHLLLYFELSHGSDYVLMGMNDFDEHKVENINSEYLKWSIQDFHSFVLERDDEHTTYLFSSFNSFLSMLHSHYLMIIEHFDEDPENHILECEIEMIEQLANNTDQNLIVDVLGQSFQRQ